MPRPLSLRNIHYSLSPIAFTLLLFNIFSGFLYAILKNIFQLPKQYISWLMVIHQGNYLGSECFKALYCALLSSFLGIVIIGTGFSMMGFCGKRTPKISRVKSLRSLHHLLARFLFIPLFIVVITGGLYRVVRYLNLMDKANAKMLLWLHAGTILPAIFQVVYIGSLALCLMVLSITGFLLWYKSRKARSNPLP